MEISRETLITRKTVGEAAREFLVEGRLELPAGNAPPAGVRFCRARLRELQAIPASGYVRLQGYAEVELNYLAPVDGTEQLGEFMGDWSVENGGALVFVQDIAMAAAEPEMEIEAEAFVASATAEVMDPSAFKCQLNLIAKIAASQASPTMVVTEIAADTPLEVGKEHLQLESFLGRAATQTAVSTILTLPEIKGDLLRILAKQARVAGLTVEYVRGRAMVGGRLELSMVYVSRGEDGRETLELSEWGGEGRAPIGFEVFLELPGGEAAASLLPDGRLERFNLEAIGPREVRLDAVVGVSARVYETKGVTVVTDLTPGPDEIADLRWTQFECCNLLGQAETEMVFESTLELPPGKPPVDRILQVALFPRDLEAQCAEGRCLIEGWLDVEVLYAGLGNEGEPELNAVAWRRSQGTGVPLSGLIELAEARPELDASLAWRMGRFNAEIAAGNIHLSVVLKTQVKVTENRLLAAIADAAVVPLAPATARSSMVFYLAQPGDTLWSIARRYETTVEALTRVNRIADPEALQTGTKLLIPRSPVAV